MATTMQCTRVRARSKKKLPVSRFFTTSYENLVASSKILVAKFIDLIGENLTTIYKMINVTMITLL